MDGADPPGGSVIVFGEKYPILSQRTPRVRVSVIVCGLMRSVLVTVTATSVPGASMYVLTVVELSEISMKKTAPLAGPAA